MQPNLQFLPVPISLSLSLVFGGVVLSFTVFLWFLLRPVLRNSIQYFIMGSLVWLGFLWGLTQTSFFKQLDAQPPHFLVVLVPPILLIVILFLTRRGQLLLDQLPVRQLVWLHTVRVAVEVSLWCLFLEHQIPQMMTFEGRNWDILVGVSAPLMVWIMKHYPDARWVVLGWNFASLGLLMCIVFIAILSAPVPFQLLNFAQPNVGVFKSTFIWLPGFVVPTVLWVHLVVIRRIFQTLGFEKPLRFYSK